MHNIITHQGNVNQNHRVILPWWLRGKESACNAGDPGLIPGSGRSPGGDFSRTSLVVQWLQVCLLMYGIW